jgi:microcystin-dependent protein
MYSNTAPDVVMSNDAAALTDVIVDSTMQVTTTVGAIGGSRSHENRQPYLAVNWIITLFGIYPSRS